MAPAPKLPLDRAAALALLHDIVARRLIEDMPADRLAAARKLLEEEEENALV